MSNNNNEGYKKIYIKELEKQKTLKKYNKCDIRTALMRKDKKFLKLFLLNKNGFLNREAIYYYIRIEFNKLNETWLFDFFLDNFIKTKNEDFIIKRDALYIMYNYFEALSYKYRNNEGCSIVGSYSVITSYKVSDTYFLMVVEGCKKDNNYHIAKIALQHAVPILSQKIYLIKELGFLMNRKELKSLIEHNTTIDIYKILNNVIKVCSPKKLLYLAIEIYNRNIILGSYTMLKIRLEVWKRKRKK